MKSLEKVFDGLPGGQIIVGTQNLKHTKKRPKAIVQLVREPKARLVSMYEYFHGDPDYAQHPMPGMTDGEAAQWYIDNWSGFPPITFDDFVLGLPKVVQNHHFRPQWSEHFTMADVRWRLDDVNALWRVLKVKVAPGLPSTFPHVNKTQPLKSVDEYMQELGEEALAVYEDLYGQDEQFYKDALFMP